MILLEEEYKRYGKVIPDWVVTVFDFFLLLFNLEISTKPPYGFLFLANIKTFTKLAYIHIHRERDKSLIGNS